MPPSAIVDSDLDPLDNTIFYAIEARNIWKATTLGGGDAVWASVFTPDAWESGEGTTGIIFSRIRCAKQDGLVYALGYAHAEGQSDTDYTAYCFVSSNGGATWNGYPIDTFEIDNEVDYYFASVTPGSKTACSGSTTIIDKYTYRCQGQFTGGTGWHIFDDHVNIGGSWHADPSRWPSTIKVLVTGTEYFEGYPTNNWIQFNYISFSVPVAEGGGVYRFPNINSTSVVPMQVMVIDNKEYTGTLYSWDYICTIIEVDGVPVGLGKAPFGFDVAASNVNWLYVGIGEKIMASEDGGMTWFDFYTDHGANDICIDPQAAGAIYYWSTDGDLNLLVKSVPGGSGVLTSEALMTETPMAIPLRIARDVNSGRLLALPNGTTLKMRNLGSDTELKTGLTSARGLHCYLGQKIIFVDSTDIWISDDIQAETPTITAKKGGWAAYASGINAHRMTAP